MDLYKIVAAGQRGDGDFEKRPVIIEVVSLFVRANSLEEACELAKEYMKNTETIRIHEARRA